MIKKEVVRRFKYWFFIVLFAPAIAEADLLKELGIEQDRESIDYVKNKTQFQLHPLLTEQSHPKTKNLGFIAPNHTVAALEMLLSVDQDISKKMIELTQAPELLQQASRAVQQALREKRRIYIYGCGATGRLAKQMESAFWRPFWSRVKLQPALWDKLQSQFSGVEELLIGEMTGGDRALISSLPGFEDLQLIGKLQLQDRKIQKGDVVFAVTEGGETSSVIGTILGALNQYSPLTMTNDQERQAVKQNLYFIYNNPNSVLQSFERSRLVLDSPFISKIELATGPQAIAGSTRMQATTIETFVLGVVLEDAIYQTLKDILSEKELKTLGFLGKQSLVDRLLDFVELQKNVFKSKEQIAVLTDLEAGAYAKNHFSTYFADEALIAVFTDSTERSPTFRLPPLDTVMEDPRRSWIQVWSPTTNQDAAWDLFLRRPFQGLQKEFYEKHFEAEISDPYLKEAALRSLKNAGDDQKNLYDFSFSKNNQRRLNSGDLGVLILLASETQQYQNAGNKSLTYQLIDQWIRLFSQKKASLFSIVLSDPRIVPGLKVPALIRKTPFLNLRLSFREDPLKVREQIALKMLLNAHSTAVMAKLGKIVGNSMTFVQPGNLKLIGRATYLVQTHVNQVLLERRLQKQVTYEQANAVLFDAIKYTQQLQQREPLSEVGLSMIRLLEWLVDGNKRTWIETKSILESKGLNDYMKAKK